MCVATKEDALVSCTRLAHTKHLSENKAIAPKNADIQSEVDKLEKIIKGEASAEGTPYLAPHDPYTSTA